MKSFYELIEETTQFDFNDVVLNSAYYEYFYDKEINPNRSADKLYWMRRIYMEKNILKWIQVVEHRGNRTGTLLMMDWRGVYIEDIGGIQNYILRPVGDMIGEDEFFQNSLLVDLKCVDYELYTKIYKFYHTVLLPIIHF